MTAKKKKKASTAHPIAVTDPMPANVYKLERKRPTGTAELRAIENALESIHATLMEFTSTVMRTEEKSGEISTRLSELRTTIEESGKITPEIKEILQDLDARIFRERFFTEKGGKGTIIMTDSTKLSHMDRLALSASRVASTKHKMSASDYTPSVIVVEKAQQTINLVQKFLKEHLGPVRGEELSSEVMTKIVGIWND